MNFAIEEALEQLERMPDVLERMLTGLSDTWLSCNEGEGTWNAPQVVEHLIEAEETNWLPRARHMLEYGASRPFPPFDRFKHLERGDRAVEQSLAHFKQLRAQSVKQLREMRLQGMDVETEGHHPDFGTVKLRELLSTWVVHDLTHLTQIVRVMALRYKDDVGPWSAYLSILK